MKTTGRIRSQLTCGRTYLNTGLTVIEIEGGRAIVKSKTAGIGDRGRTTSLTVFQEKRDR